MNKRRLSNAKPTRQLLMPETQLAYKNELLQALGVDPSHDLVCRLSLAETLEALEKTAQAHGIALINRPLSGIEGLCSAIAFVRQMRRTQGARTAATRHMEFMKETEFEYEDDHIVKSQWPDITVTGWEALKTHYRQFVPATELLGYLQIQADTEIVEPVKPYIERMAKYQDVLLEGVRVVTGETYDRSRLSKELHVIGAALVGQFSELQRILQEQKVAWQLPTKPDTIQQKLNLIHGREKFANTVPSRQLAVAIGLLLQWCKENGSLDDFIAKRVEEGLIVQNKTHAASVDERRAQAGETERV